MGSKHGKVYDFYRGEPREDGLVPCYRCKEWIVETTTDCEHCGMNFVGEAGDFVPGAPDWKSKTRVPPGWMLLVAGIIVLAILFVALGMSQLY